MTEYEQLSAAIESRIASDPQLRALRKKIKNGTATLAESSKYSQLCAQIMGQKLSGQVLELSDREGVCTQLLHDRYSDTNQVCEQVMRSVDERAGIAMNPRHAAFPAERVQQLAHSLTDPTVQDETIQRRANTGAANVAISFHDDFVDENAAFRSDAGYECYITRVVGGASCPWCSGMAGRYKYEEMPEDMFRRHDNCTCTVTFEQGAFRQDVWSKRSWEAPETGAGAQPPKVFSQEEANRLEQEHLAQIRGLRFNSSSIDNSQINDIISLRDDNSLYKPVTQEAIDGVPKLDIFDDDEMNKRHQQAAKDLLTEVKKRDDVPVGTEFSIRYDKDMKPINGETYLQGEEGSVPLHDYGKPFHAFHNHGSNGSLSYNDLRKFASSDNMLSLTAQGHLGNMYTVAASDSCDREGYRLFLKRVGEKTICIINGQKISLDFLSNKENEIIVDNMRKFLSDEEKGKISAVIISRIDECLNGGAEYGVKYYKA